MKEHLYTIPVNEAFDHGDGCPFCRLFENLEKTELDLILGASMMEPEVRQITNEKGFCERHFAKMIAGNNKLGVALILESHLESLKSGLKPGGVFARDISAKSRERIEKLDSSCYVCDRIDEKIGKMYETAAFLFDEEKDFRRKFDSVGFICLPHYRRLLEAGARVLSKDGYSELARAANGKINAYLSKLKDDISLFCKKFDYRFDDLPWGNSKDSVERSVKFLKGAKK